MNTLFTLVLIELLGEDSLANAFGWLNFFGGAGYILGPFIAGTLPSYKRGRLFFADVRLMYLIGKLSLINT